MDCLNGSAFLSFGVPKRSWINATSETPGVDGSIWVKIPGVTFNCRHTGLQTQRSLNASGKSTEHIKNAATP
jgi:hypothetical protein